MRLTGDKGRMKNPLRLGVIGLGRNWRRRYRVALRAMPERFKVQAVYDQVRGRAERAAAALGCEAFPAMTALLEHADIDALLLADRQWFGLWPADAARETNKPIYCGGGLIPDRLPAEARPPIMLELLPRFAPATARLREILGAQLGPVRLVVCEAVKPERSSKGARPSLLGSVGVALLDWCLAFMEGEPASVLAAGLADGGIENLFLEFPDGRAVQVMQRRGPCARARLRLHIVAEKGCATVAPPRHVSWTGADGRHVHALPRGRSLTGLMLEHFFQAVREEKPLTPGLEEVRRPLALLEAARQSRREGRRVALPPASLKPGVD